MVYTNEEKYTKHMQGKGSQSSKSFKGVVDQIIRLHTRNLELIVDMTKGRNTFLTFNKIEGREFNW